MFSSCMKWIYIPLAAVSLFTALDSQMADAAINEVASSASSGTMQSPLQSVYCSSPEHCLGIGAYFAERTSDGGRSWARYPISHAATVLNTDFGGLACATPQVCMAYGRYYDVIGNPKQGNVIVRTAVARTIDGGRTWTPAAPPPKGFGPLISSLSCPTKNYCLVAGESSNGNASKAWTTTNMGRSWRRLNLGKGEELFGVSCETRRFCVAEGSNFTMATTNNGGSTWRPSSGFGGYTRISSVPTCIALTHCFIVGSDQDLNAPPTALIYESTDGGKIWTKAALRPDTFILSQISCASAASCVAAGGGSYVGNDYGPDLLTTSDGGTSWTMRSLPASISGINGISCPTVTWCMVVGSADYADTVAAIVVTDDGGATWTNPLMYL